MIHIEAYVYNAFQVNTYLVRDDAGHCLVVDPACYTPDEKRDFDRVISDNGLKVTGQVNTHCHVDHMLGVQHVQHRYHCPFSAHKLEEEVVNNVPLMGDMYGLVVEPFSGIDQLLEDNGTIHIGDNELLMLHVPGHSPGSLSFYSPDGGFVITGDALFKGSIGRTDLPGGDYDTLIASIRNRLLTLPPETIVYPGHGDSSTIGEESLDNPFLTMVQ